MNYFHKTQEIRNYKKGGKAGKLSIKTICDKTFKKVGSADCEKNCIYFAGIDRDNKIVRCWK